MNYKRSINLNSRKIVVEFNFSTIFVLLFILYLLAIISNKYIDQLIFCKPLQMDLSTESTSISMNFASKVEFI